MSTKDDGFLEQLRATFKVEAEEHLQSITAGLLELERASASDVRRKIIETVFRAAHSLKGAARSVDFTDIESLCQSLEDTFASWKRQGSAPSTTALDQLHRTLSAVTASMSAAEASRRASPPAAQSTFRPPATHLDVSGPVPVEAVAATPVAERRAFSTEETVRISVAKLDARLAKAEELLTAKLTTGQRVGDLRALTHSFEAWRNEWAAVEPEARTLRQANDRPVPGRADHPGNLGVARLLGFLDWNLEHLKSLESKMAAVTRAAEQDRYAVGKLVDDLLEDSKKLLLLPFATLAAPLPKLVRDLCRDQGKEADLTIRGEDVEIDKRILEEMKDPLMHLLRNSIDHGIELPDERARQGKPSRAAITLAVTQVEGNKVQLFLSDDGAGIDTGKVIESAVKHGLVSAGDAGRLGEAEAQALIFRSEVSTSPIISQLSGRGLGLAIVREKAEKLGGEVSVESHPGRGTAFRIIMPMTRATSRGILVEAAGRLLVVPTAQVDRVARARPDDIQTVEGRETISIDGRAVVLVQLANVLELPPAERMDAPAAGAPVIILGDGDQRVAFAVDAVLDEQEVLVKPLRKPLSRVRNVAAATVLGSGQVAPILNVADLLKSARKVASASTRVVGGTKSSEVRAVLVAEDSITSRMLIKSILESAGYRVKTAVDGMEAFTLLRAEKFDLVVSDVEMPRLNGFDLTARIRADKKLTELPVVLVTALETREDRERGIDVGANAYLVKSSLDQSNLLEAVRRLV
ncbi:MAG: hybrid sensor histidine kinase/response regulator [Casimicrobiaceae bacterium]